MGSHHIHPYAVQAAAFLISLIVPGLVFVVLGGAAWEHRRRNGRKPVPEANAPIFAFSRD